MELLIWFWLYDKRWCFNVEYPNYIAIWCLPLTLNLVLIFVSLLGLNYTNYINDAELDFWLKVKLILMVVSSFATIIVILQSFFIKAKELREMNTTKKRSTVHSINYHFWIRRNILTSQSGITVFYACICSILWTVYGKYSLVGSVNSSYISSLKELNIIQMFQFLETIFLLPLLFNLCSFIIIRFLCILLTFTLPYLWMKINGGNPERNPNNYTYLCQTREIKEQKIITVFNPEPYQEC